MSGNKQYSSVYSWRRIKRNFLHHYNRPRLDLLVWILVKKLAPVYYRKLDVMLVSTGRYRELPSWRKAFKRAWKKATDTPISIPLNEKYRPDPHQWVCTCPSFLTSRFLLCKHLVQAVQPVPPHFFLEVNRNRTTPFWTHKTLIPLENDPPMSADTPTPHTSPDTGSLASESDSDDEQDVDDSLIDMGTNTDSTERLTFRERLLKHIHLLQDFCGGLEFQLQFSDQRMLQVLEREGAGMLRLAENCLDRERRFNTTRGDAPTTWEKATLNAMFYRPRPQLSDSHT
jgi:hypothetical protein